jgi:hypothetical protein
MEEFVYWCFLMSALTIVVTGLEQLRSPKS